MPHADWLITGLEKVILSAHRKTSGNTFPYRPRTRLISPYYLFLQMIITCGCSDDIKNGLELSKTRGIHITTLLQSINLAR